MDDLLRELLEEFPYADFSDYAKPQIEGWIKAIHAAHNDYLQDMPYDADPDEAMDAVLETLAPSDDDEITIARIVDIYQRMIDFC